MARLSAARVAVFGVGGVGGYAVEALARSGVGALVLVDSDRFALSNLNRQLHATRATLGRDKVRAAAARVREISPDCRVEEKKVFFLPETRAEFDFAGYDYVVDAIDTVAGKLALAEAALAAGTPIISAMGAGNKLDPTLLRVADIYETSVCPLARIMRQQCRRRGIPRLKVVYSEETPLSPAEIPGGEAAPPGRRAVPGSAVFVPAAMGLILAAEVVRDLAGVPKPRAGR